MVTLPTKHQHSSAVAGWEGNDNLLCTVISLRHLYNVVTVKHSLANNLKLNYYQE